MATAESVQRKIQGLIATANNVTGNNDYNLTAAVNSLADGYGQVLEELSIKENGVYTPNKGVHGFSKVIANIPSIAGGGVTLLESGTIEATSSINYISHELIESPDLVLIWADTEITGTATAGWVLGVLPIPILTISGTVSGTISNFISALRCSNGNITNGGSVGSTGIILTDGVPSFRAQRVSASYPLIDGNYVYQTYKLWN